MVQPSITDKITMICDVCGTLSNKAHLERDFGGMRPGQKSGRLPEAWEWTILQTDDNQNGRLLVKCKECK